MVASFAEAWIEIPGQSREETERGVASFAEAWIEIFFCLPPFAIHVVASFAEAWIEISKVASPGRKTMRRFLRGSVD